MIFRLDPPIPIFTPKGNAWAHLVIDNGIETDLLWVCFIDHGGECWTFSNRDIRAQKNITLGRNVPNPFYDPSEAALLKDAMKEWGESEPDEPN